MGPLVTLSNWFLTDWIVGGVTEILIGLTIIGVFLLGILAIILNRFFIGLLLIVISILGAVYFIGLG